MYSLFFTWGNRRYISQLANVANCLKFEKAVGTEIINEPKRSKTDFHPNHRHILEVFVEMFYKNNQPLMTPIKCLCILQFQ